MWLRLSKVSQCIVYCSYGNNNHLDTEEGKKFKGTATGNRTHYHTVPADIAGAYWKRAEVSSDIGGWTVGKGQLHLQLIHPPKAPVYYCNSLGPGLASRLSHICQEKTKSENYSFPYRLISTAQYVPVLLNCQMRPSLWQIWCGPLLPKRLERFCLWSLPAPANESSNA